MLPTDYKHKSKKRPQRSHMREIFPLIRDQFGTFWDILKAFVLPFTRRKRSGLVKRL